MTRDVARVEAMYVYPVKGLSGTPLARVDLEEGRGFPSDREYALARPDGAYDASRTEPLPKDQFFMLARNRRLAGVDTSLDPATNRFVARVRGHVVLDVNFGTDSGRKDFSALFARMLDLPAGTGPILARAEGRRFTDVSVVSEQLMHAVSIINLASVRDLEDKIGRTLDLRRFRANIYLDGLAPWAELNLVGHEIELGSGVRLRAALNTRRCAATEVDPTTTVRDVAIPRLLMEHYGHSEIGVYATVVAGGELGVGDHAWTRRPTAAKGTT